MNQLHTDRRSFGSWGLTALAGAVSTTAVAVVFSSILSTPAYSASMSLMPADPAYGTSVHTDGPATRDHLCFMGRHSWSDAIAGPQPTCQV